MELLGKYKNGNYTVAIYKDGTKIRATGADSFEPTFPESIDLKITNQCERGCAFCHENSTPDGKHSDLLNLPFFRSIPPYTELAIGGGNPLSHPDLERFLEKCQSRHIIANITVHEAEFFDNAALLWTWVSRGLIHGIGISHTSPKYTERLLRYLTEMYRFSTAVIHVINGVVSLDDLEKFADKNLNLLILGYKDIRRGQEYQSRYMDVVSMRQQTLKENLPRLAKDGHFRTICFDNLALEQLDVQRLVTSEEWESLYMGDDGKFTMYIDAVELEYAMSSTSMHRYPCENTVQAMFQRIRQESNTINNIERNCT